MFPFPTRENTSRIDDLTRKIIELEARTNAYDAILRGILSRIPKDERIDLIDNANMRCPGGYPAWIRVSLPSEKANWQSELRVERYKEALSKQICSFADEPDKES